MGFNINNFSFEESVSKALELIKSDGVSQVVTINPEMIIYSEKHPEFKEIIDRADMVIPDGVGIKIALILKGQSANRIPGIDFAKCLLDKCANENIPVAIIGAREEIITKAAEKLKEELRELNIVYAHNGYFKNDNDIYDELNKSGAKLILVAMGSPRQEEFIYNAKKILHPCLMVGIGGSLDVWSGATKRAPEIYKKLGFEWLYRTVKQPERFKRIFPTLPLFLIKAIIYKPDNK